MAIDEKWKVVWTDDLGVTTTESQHDTEAAADAEVASKESSNGAPDFQAHVTKITYSDTP